MKTLLAAMIVAAFSCLPAYAQPVCWPRADVLAALEGQYGERPAAIGLSNDGTLIEITISPDGATWSLVESTPAGLSCLRTAGEDWRTLAPQKKDSF